MTRNPFPRLYRETARHPDNVALLNALGAYLSSRPDRPPRRTGYSVLGQTETDHLQGGPTWKLSTFS